MNEWTNARLADVAEIRFSNVDKKTDAAESPVRLCNYMDVYGNSGYITAGLPFMEASASRAEIERFGVANGDVIVTKDSETPDDIGVPAVVVDDIPNLVCGYHLALIKPDHAQVDPIYLAKQLGSKATASYFSKLANGSTRYGLSSSSIASTRIPIAPLPQQRRIAEILTTLDETIEQTEALIAKYQQIKAGLMHDLFTRGVTPDGRLRPTRDQAPHLYKESPLGWIPSVWGIKNAGDLCLPITKGATPFQVSEAATLSDVPFIRVLNLTFDGTLDFESNKSFIALAASDELARSRVFPGDILMNLVGPPLGKVSLVPATYAIWNINQAIAIFRTQESTVRDFLLRYLLSDISQSWLLARAKRTSGQVNLTLEMCRQLPVPFPVDPNERDRISNTLVAIDSRVTTEREHLTKLCIKKCGLMHDLLAGRVRVKVTEVAAV